MWYLLFMAALPAALQGAPASLDLAALLQQARAANHDILSARGRLAAAQTVPSQVQALPDPLASVSWTNESLNGMTLGDADGSNLTFTWQQEVPYPGKRRLAGEAARRDAEAAALEVEQREVEVLAQVKEAYADLYRLDRASAILGENRQLLGAFLETARVRYESGEGLLQNVLKAQTEAAKLDVEIERVKQQRIGVEANMRTLIGDVASAIPLGPALELPETLPPVEPARLEEEALSHSPEVLRAEALSRAGSARVDLARRQLKPDFMYGAAYSYRGDLDPMVMGSFGVRLPLYREAKQAQALVQAWSQMDALGYDLAGARLRVLSEVRDLVARADRAARLGELYSESILPQARSSLDSARAAYGVGRVDFLTLLSDFSAVLQYELESEVQRAERVSALAGLERLTALRLLDDGTGFREARP